VHLAGIKRRNSLLQNSIFNKSEGKPVPLQSWTGLEGSRRLRLIDFKKIGTGM